MKKYTGIVRDTMSDQKYSIEIMVSDSASKEEIEKEAVRVAFDKLDSNSIELVRIKKDGDCCNVSMGLQNKDITQACHFRGDQQVTEEDILHDMELL